MSLDALTTFSTTMLPADLSNYEIIHVSPLGDAEMQLEFVRACRQRGAKKISGGTGLFNVETQPQAVRAVIEEVDYFFLNKTEAERVFGSLELTKADPGRVIFITLGDKGACIVQGDTKTLIPAVPTTEFDPTGAGDTFCGASLAYLIQNAHPIMAARRAVKLAAEMITQVGPAALLSKAPPPEVPLEGSVRINEEQVGRFAEKISMMPEAAPFPFDYSFVPPVGHPKALDYFFASTLQQFGFWSTKNNIYHRPLIATIDGEDLKGSDYLWVAYRRRLEVDADFCSPERQADLSREELLEVFRAENGGDPMPALDLHLEYAHKYGRDMLALKLTPQAVLDKALSCEQPLKKFLAQLDKIGGYREDPLRKKSNLLAMILNQRPETFLPLRKDEQIEPVIDYHALRSCLRIGLIDVVDEEMRGKLINRQTLLPSEEWAVRYAAYRAEEQVVAQSGKSTGAVDWFLYSARKRCPEMTEPECERCPVDPVCAHRKELFQPVIRTSFY
jgi:hypothetical protein